MPAPFGPTIPKIVSCSYSRCDQSGGRKREPKRDACFDRQKGRGVRADFEERGMSQGDRACVACDDVKAHGQHHEYPDCNCHCTS